MKVFWIERTDFSRVSALAFASVTLALSSPADVAGVPGEETYRAYEPSNGWTRVDYVLRPTSNSLIRCRLVLPSADRWTGRFWGLGNSSEGGNVIHDPFYVRRGDASVHCDLGTSGGRHYLFPEVFDDYGWRATHLMTVTGKALTEAFYGKKITKAYFRGGSTGGNQGMREAMDFPEDYDGIAVDVPAQARLSMCALYWWIGRVIRDESGKVVVSEAQCKAMAQAAIDWFADKDEPYARGRFLTDPRYSPEKEDAIYRLAAARCAELNQPGMRERWHAIFTGPVINGRRAHAGFPFGADLTGLTRRHNYNLAWYVGRDADVVNVPETAIEGYARHFGSKIAAEKEDLTAFAARGGKLIVMPGLEDEYVPYTSALDWYERMSDRMGGLERVRAFCRFFLLPGRAHWKGRGMNQPKAVHDILVAWVEKGSAPERLEADDYPIAAYPNKITGDAAGGWRQVPFGRLGIPLTDPLYQHGSALDCAASAGAGMWYYRPYEYEVWELQRMRAEADRGVLHFSYPGNFMRLGTEPSALYSETPVEGYEAIPGAPGVPPHRLTRPLTEMRVKSVGDGIYDLEHIDIGYVCAKADDRPDLFVGESLPEVRNSDTNGFEQSVLMVSDGTPGCWRSDIPLALRYFRFGNCVRSCSFRSQVDWREPVGRFTCGDARKERLWRLGVETLRLCTRTFLVDGVKRDRLPWAADLVVGILAEAYTFGDPEPIKRTLSALGSGDMTQGNVNGIAAFSLWWVIAHDLLQRYFGEADYLRLHYPKIRARMAEIATHEDERGFFAKDLGWDFMDWTDRKGGSLKSEITRQIIYFGALQAAVRLAERMGDGESAAKWTAKSEKLKAAILAAGMDRTRHARMLAIVFGLVDGETARRYAAEIAAGDLPPTVTPYMSTFEVMALAKAGEGAAALRKFESVWGEMTDFGVDAYWEGWDPADKGDEVYEFYGRPFGKSLCHAWASGPAFLIPGVFLGIRPTADGWAEWEEKPTIPAFAPDAKVVVGTKSGLLTVAVAKADSACAEGDFVAVEWSERDGERWTVNGLADREAGRLMATNTVFAICSNTKPLASVLVLTFVEEGVLNLDDPVSKHFPEFAEIRLKGKRPKNPVTLRHLITHTTGIDAFSLCNPGVLPDMTPFRDQVRLAVAKGLRCEPGTEYRYSNAGFGIMGAILEKVTGRKVADLMQERIFNPLGMADATFYPDGKILERAAVPYYFPPDGSAPMRYDFTNRLTSPLDDTARTPLLSSCVFCTAGDYLKFSQMIACKGLGLNGRRILSEKTFTDYLLTRQTPPGDKTDASFDIHFNAEHTEGSKGGLYATSASWNWANRSCKVVFQAKSPYAPKGVKSKLDATGFGGGKTIFGIDDQRFEDGKASCLLSNNGDRHGVAAVECILDGVSVGTQTVELAIGEAKRVEFECANRPHAKAEFKVVQ